MEKIKAMPKPSLRKPASTTPRQATRSRKCEAADSSFGRFSASGDRFTITDPLAPPRAQVNFLWNDTLISGLNQFGSGEGVFNNQTLTLNHPEGRVRLIADGLRFC